MIFIVKELYAALLPPFWSVYMQKKTVKLIIFITFMIAVLVISYVSGLYGYLAGGAFADDFQIMIKDNFAKAALIYVGVTVVACSLLAIPGVTFAIIAGAVFGPLWGTILCLIACTIGAIIAFIAGRYFLRSSVRDKVIRSKYINRFLFDNETKNEMLVLMITRLVPIFPYNLQNFAYGITDMSLIKYSIGTFIFMIPGTAMYTVGTNAITDSRNRLIYIVITILLVLFVTLSGKFIKKKYIQPEEQEPQDQTDHN